MNEWDKIWKNRKVEIDQSNDLFAMFCSLKSADGFDVQTQNGYYEAFWKQWHDMAERILRGCNGSVKSVYEVGCGSGVNLYLFQKKYGCTVGGIDYSLPLVNIAKDVLSSRDLSVGNADEITEQPQYDLMLADSVFQYFTDIEYGKAVLEKMFIKAAKMLVVTEIHDLSRRDEHLSYRRKYIENYDEKYKGLEKNILYKRNV